MSCSPPPHVLKRKAPPLLDSRYPTPDPADPFAPLWVLRSRASNVLVDSQTLDHNPRRFELYPDNSGITDHSQASGASPRTSTPTSSSITFPTTDTTSSGGTPPPKKITFPFKSISRSDSSTNDGSTTDVELVVAVPPKSEPDPYLQRSSTATKLAKFLLPAKIRTSLTLADDRPGSPTAPGKRIYKQSISSPTNFKHVSFVGKPPDFDPSEPVVASSHALDQEPRLSPLCLDVSTPPVHPQRVRSSVSTSNVHFQRPSRPLTTSTASPATMSPLLSTNVFKLSTSRSMPNDILSRKRPSTAPAVIPSATTPNVHHHNQLFVHHHGHPPPLVPRPPTTSGPSELPLNTEWAMPTRSQLTAAASLSVIAESGIPVRFSSLFQEHCTIVVFIRHFWCPLCQDYMASLSSLGHPDMMFADAKGKEQSGRRQRVQLVVIGNGSPNLIPKYKKLFDFPFRVFTDPSLALYTTLGMGRSGENTNRARMSGTPREKRETCQIGIVDGGYVRHGLVSGVAMVVRRAIKAGMPVWEHGGDLLQLGGEFIFGPGLQCSYAHRMQFQKGHAPVADILEAAGIRPQPQAPLQASPLKCPAGRGGKLRKSRSNSVKEIAKAKVELRKSTDTTPVQDLLTSQSYSGMTLDEEVEWMARRSQSMEMLKEKKILRRTFGALLGRDGIRPLVTVAGEDKEPDEVKAVSSQED